MKRSELQYFSQDDLWRRTAVSEQLAVAEDLIELIPEDVDSILDAGCGNGTVTNKLFPRWDVVACDLSESAVRHVDAPALVADLCAIPFVDKQFDLTLSSDVIEHLPDSIYSQVLTEIARVSARYILVAVPYRELLDAASIDCPACGHRYHAHLHQRSYTVDDVVSLFAPEFTAIDVRFSGESWVFEDPELLNFARLFSGLDYPFEDGVCPECGTRRGLVDRSDRAEAVQRRFESLQAMLVAEGLRQMPCSSEILVLFERDSSGKTNWSAPLPAEVLINPLLRISSLVQLENPKNYPRDVYRLPSDSDYCVITLPRRPSSMRVVGGRVESVEIYDHVRGRYASAVAEADNLEFQLPRVPFGHHGCMLRMLCPSEDLVFELDIRPHDWVAVVDCCLGDDPLTKRVQERGNQLLALTEQLEMARSELEIKYQEKEGECVGYIRAIAEVNDLANDIEKKRADIDKRLSELNAVLADREKLLGLQVEQNAELLLENKKLKDDLAAVRESYDSLFKGNGARLQELEETTLKVKQLNELACSLESRRAALEERVKSDGSQMTALEREVERLHADNYVLIEQNKLLGAELGLSRARVLEYQACAEQVSELESKNHALRIALESPGSELENSALVSPQRKVLIVSHMYPRDYNPVGGIFVHEQVKALRAQGIDARVVSGEPFWINTLNPRQIKSALGAYCAEKASSWTIYDGVPVIRFPYIVSALLPFQAHAITYSQGLIRNATWLYQDFPFELIHAHTAYTDGTAGRRLANRFNVPLVITEHTGPFSTLTRTPYLKYVTRRALNASARVISVSSSLLADIRGQVKLKPGLNAQVISNLVDTGFFVEQDRLRDELVHMLWVGHFVPVKRVPVLIEAFAAAYKKRPNLRLRLAGGGEGIDEAQHLVRQLGVAEVVEFVGYATREQLVGYYRDCDFLVISSACETFGVVAIEAMSCGRPVLTSCCGGPEDVVTHPNLGRVVDMSVQALAEGMLDMIEHISEFDSGIIREVVELRFSAPSIARKLINVYRELLVGAKS